MTPPTRDVERVTVSRQSVLAWAGDGRVQNGHVSSLSKLVLFLPRSSSVFFFFSWNVTGRLGNCERRRMRRRHWERRLLCFCLPRDLGNRSSGQAKHLPPRAGTSSTRNLARSPRCESPPCIVRIYRGIQTKATEIRLPSVLIPSRKLYSPLIGAVKETRQFSERSPCPHFYRCR